jgi:hypothetical protein
MKLNLKAGVLTQQPKKKIRTAILRARRRAVQCPPVNPPLLFFSREYT